MYTSYTYLLAYTLYVTGISTVEEVQAKIHDFKQRFKALKESTQEVLEQQGISVKRVADHLKGLSAYDIPEHKMFRKSHIFEVESHVELFGAMDIFWSYLAYHLLEHLITKFSMTEMEGKLEKYRKDIRQFMGEAPMKVFSQAVSKKEIEPPPGFLEMVVKCAWPEDATMMAVEEFQRKYASYYNLRELAMMFITIESGPSFTLTWFIPESIVERLMVEVAEKLLSSNNITRLEIVGACVYLKEELQQVISP